MIRKLLVGMAGAVAMDYVTDNKEIQVQIEKAFKTAGSQNMAYAAANGLGAALAIKYFGG